MITIRLEYSGMRAERTASDMASAITQASEMFANHGILRTTIVGNPDRPDYWRGRVTVTNRHAVVRFIDETVL